MPHLWVPKRRAYGSLKRLHFDFENKVWTIPPENSQAGEEHGKSHCLDRLPPTIEGYLKEAFELSAGEQVWFLPMMAQAEVMGVRAPLAIPYNIMQYLRRKEAFEIEHFSMHDLSAAPVAPTSRQSQSFTSLRSCWGIASGVLSKHMTNTDYLAEQAECL